MSPTSTRIPVLVAAILLATACGSTSEAASSESRPTSSPIPVITKTQHVASVDACTLVTADDASAAIGSPMTSLTASGAGVQIPGACIYGSSGSSSTVFVFAQVYPDAATANAVQPDQLAALLAGQFTVTNSHPVSGIGDKAFEYTAAGTAGGGIAIFVFKYNVVMFIAVDPTSDPGPIETLARTAVGRLVVS